MDKSYKKSEEIVLKDNSSDRLNWLNNSVISFSNGIDLPLLLQTILLLSNCYDSKVDSFLKKC